MFFEFPDVFFNAPKNREYFVRFLLGIIVTQLMLIFALIYDIDKDKY